MKAALVAIERIERIERAILVLRGHKVMFDTDLAALYEVETRVLVQAVNRNAERFPEDFMFQLQAAELERLRSQSVISNTPGRGGRRRLEQLEAKTDAKFKAVFEAIRQLMVPVEPRKRSIGFVTPKEK